MNRRNLLKPDLEGHYSREALALDAESLQRTPGGRHPMDALADSMALEHTRRKFFARGAQGIGALALASLLGEGNKAAAAPLAGLPHFAPKAKRCIYLHLVGAPPQMET